MSENFIRQFSFAHFARSSRPPKSLLCQQLSNSYVKIVSGSLFFACRDLQCVATGGRASHPSQNHTLNIYEHFHFWNQGFLCEHRVPDLRTWNPSQCHHIVTTWEMLTQHVCLFNLKKLDVIGWCFLLEKLPERCRKDVAKTFVIFLTLESHSLTSNGRISD